MSPRTPPPDHKTPFVRSRPATGPYHALRPLCDAPLGFARGSATLPLVSRGFGCRAARCGQSLDRGVGNVEKRLDCGLRGTWGSFGQEIPPPPRSPPALVAVLQEFPPGSGDRDPRPLLWPELSADIGSGARSKAGHRPPPGRYALGGTPRGTGGAEPPTVGRCLGHSLSPGYGRAGGLFLSPPPERCPKSGESVRDPLGYLLPSLPRRGQRGALLLAPQDLPPTGGSPPHRPAGDPHPKPSALPPGGDARHRGPSPLPRGRASGAAKQAEDALPGIRLDARCREKGLKGKVPLL